MHTKIRTCNNDKNQRNFTAGIVNILKKNSSITKLMYVCVYIYNRVKS